MIERLEACLDRQPNIVRREISDRDLKALIAVAKAARESKLVWYHMDTCDKELAPNSNYACNCGHDALRAALAALEQTGERGNLAALTALTDALEKELGENNGS